MTELNASHIDLINEAVQAFNPLNQLSEGVDSSKLRLEEAKHNLDEAKKSAAAGSVDAFVALAVKARGLNTPLEAAHIREIANRAAEQLSDNEKTQRVRASEIKKVLTNSHHVEEAVLALREASEDIKFNIRGETLKILTKINKADADTDTTELIGSHVSTMRANAAPKIVTDVDKFRRSVERMFESWDMREDNAGKKILADAEKLVHRMEKLEKKVETTETETETETTNVEAEVETADTETPAAGVTAIPETAESSAVAGIFNFDES